MNETRAWGTDIAQALAEVPRERLLKTLHERLARTADLDELILETERDLARCEAAVTIGVLSQTTEDGKSLYSNDKLRDAATKDAIWQDGTCGEVRAAAHALRTQRAYASADIEVLRAGVKLVCAVTL